MIYLIFTWICFPQWQSLQHFIPIPKDLFLSCSPGMSRVLFPSSSNGCNPRGSKKTWKCNPGCHLRTNCAGPRKYRCTTWNVGGFDLSCLTCTHLSKVEKTHVGMACQLYVTYWFNVRMYIIHVMPTSSDNVRFLHVPLKGPTCRYMKGKWWAQW